MPHGGAEIDVAFLARALVAEGWEVHVVIASWPGAPAWLERDGVALHPLYAPSRRGNTLRVPWLIGRALASIAPDVVIQESAGAETGLCAYWARRIGARFVYRAAHDIDCSGEYERWDRLRGRIYRWGLRRAELVLALTERQRELLDATYGLGPRTALLPYAHPPADAAPRPRAARTHVLWIGRFEPWKRPELVVELARRLPGLRFRLVGGLTTPTAARVGELAAGLDNVELPGRVPFDETGELFAGALALVSTSRYEGYPHAFLQALRAGTPICSLEVDPDGTLAGGAHGRVAGGDLDRLAAALAGLADDPRYDEVAAAAQAHFAAHHDLTAVAARLSRLLRELVDRRS